MTLGCIPPQVPYALHPPSNTLRYDEPELPPDDILDWVLCPQTLERAQAAESAAAPPAATEPMVVDEATRGISRGISRAAEPMEVDEATRATGATGATGADNIASAEDDDEVLLSEAVTGIHGEGTDGAAKPPAAEVATPKAVTAASAAAASAAAAAAAAEAMAEGVLCGGTEVSEGPLDFGNFPPFGTFPPGGLTPVASPASSPAVPFMSPHVSASPHTAAAVSPHVPLYVPETVAIGPIAGLPAIDATHGMVSEAMEDAAAQAEEQARIEAARVATMAEMIASSLPPGAVSVPGATMPSSGSGRATASWRSAKRKASSPEVAPTAAEAPSRASAAPAQAEQAPAQPCWAPAEPPVVLPSDAASEAAVEEVAAAADSRVDSGANQVPSAITRCSVCGTGKKGPKNPKRERDDWKCPECRPPLDPNAEGEAEAEARVAEAARKQAGEPAPSPEASMNHLRSAMGLSMGSVVVPSVVPSAPALPAAVAAAAPACSAAALRHAVQPPAHRPAAATTSYAAAAAAANAAAAHEAAAAIAAAAAATVTADGVFPNGTPRYTPGSTAGASSRLHRWRLVRGEETWVLSATPTYEIEDGIQPYVLQLGEERLTRSSLVRRLGTGGFEAKRLTWEHSEHLAKVFGPRIVKEARQLFDAAHKAAVGRAEGQPSGLLEVVRLLLLIEGHVEVEAMRAGHWTTQKRECWLKLVLKATRPSERGFSERGCEDLSHGEVVLQQIGKFADAIAALTPAFRAGFDHWKERLQFEVQRQTQIRDAQIRDAQVWEVQTAKRRRSSSQTGASPMEAPDTFDGTACLGLLAELCDGLVHWEADAGQLA